MLHGLSLVRQFKNTGFDATLSERRLERLQLARTLLDSGSAITLVGAQCAQQWIAQGFAQKVRARKTSIRGIRGIGALNQVLYWVCVTVDIGGVLVTFQDIPVIDGHDGFLIGNDFLGKGRTAMQYLNTTTGTLTLFGADCTTPISSPVGFQIIQDSSGPQSTLLAFTRDRRHRRRKLRRRRRPPSTGTPCLESDYETDCETDSTGTEVPGESIADVSLAADFGDISPTERAERAEQQKQAAEVEEAIKGITPVGWAPETIEIPAWSEAHFKVRLPASLVKARDVLLLPLEDERQKDIGVLIAPTLQKVTEDGYAWCRAINMDKKQKRIPLLTPLVRFQVDPRVYNIEYEYTTDEIMEKIQLSPDLSKGEREQVRHLIESRRVLFSSKLGYTHTNKMSIKVKAGTNPPNATLRPRPDEEQVALQQEVKKQLKAGLIEPCRSPYGALPMLVKKPTKEGQPQAWRLVLDYRGVNAVLEKDVYRLPNLQSNLSALGKANFFSCVDLLQGFNQVELADDGSKEITAFNTEMGQFQYVRMPMGLASSPSTFMRIVDATLRGLPPGIALAYVDDICIPTCGSFEDHMRDVGLVFDRLIEAGFTVRCDKCQIGLKEVAYLGFQIGAYGTRPLPEKTQAILDLAASDMHGNPAAAARYAGMLGVYAKFIPNLMDMLGPFHDLKAKAAPVASILGSPHNPPSLRFLASFEATRHALATVVARSRPDPTQPYYIFVDAASSCGIGAILLQRADPDDPESLRPVETWSRRLSDEERGYGVRDQECLGLYETLRLWRHYILGKKVELMSDHSSLQWLLTTSHADASRVAGYALYAQAYDITISYVPGVKNVVADLFSRTAKSTEPVREQGAAGKRAPIEERLDDASLTACEASDIADVQSDCGSDLSDAATVCAVGEGRQAHRAAFLLARPIQKEANSPGNGRFEVLLETVAGVSSLPSVAVDTSTTGFTYRKQLARGLSASDDLLTALDTAISFKRRSSRSSCHYFTNVIHSLTPLTLPSTLRFVEVSEEVLTMLEETEDQRFLRLFARELSIPHIDHRVSNDWIGRFRRVRALADTVIHGNQQPASMTAASDDLPTIDTAPHGPAFCETVEHGQRAIQLLHARLRAHPGLSMAVDLEGLLGGRRGHVELLQVSVDGTSDEQPQLTFVFDTHRQGAQFLGTGLLRKLLEDGGVPKVLHCSYGDASCLFNEYGIRLDGAFDTGVADCVLRHVGLNRQRRLDKVIEEHVPQATLKHKGTFQHIPHMFAKRPLPLQYFEYAYEDVIYCNMLYRAMRDKLDSAGLLEVTLALSALRSPPLSLSPSHPAYRPASNLVVVLRDNSNIVCLQNYTTGDITVPQGSFDRREPDVRWQAQQLWNEHMGSALGKAIANRMRKAVRISDTLLFEVVVNDCTALLTGLRASQELMGIERNQCVVVTRPFVDPTGDVRTTSKQKVVLQYLAWQASQQTTAETNVVLGRTVEKTRIATVLHDDTHVYCLRTATPGMLQFPSCPLEVGADPVHMAEKAFDLFAGPALRRPTGGLELMATTSKAIRESFDNIKELTTSGNTTYYACYVPQLSSYVAAFYAAARTVNGFRLTATLQKRHPGFVLCTWETACPLLDPDNDIAAARILQPQMLNEIKTTTAVVEAGPVSQHSGDGPLFQPFHSAASAYERSTPDLDETSAEDSESDPETEALFDAAVLIAYTSLMEDTNVAQAFASNIGTAPDTTPPTEEAIRREQRAHPATWGIVEYLEQGDLSSEFTHMSQQDQQQRKEVAKNYFINGDGLLCRFDDVNKQPNPAGLVVLPPKFRLFYLQQYHDRTAHFGVKKTSDLLRQRFYWGSFSLMRKDVARHIRHCHPCQVSKMPTHPAGEAQLGFCGHHPWDVVCGDLYYVGICQDKYDHTLDFACFFSRRIRSEPLQGVPSSEQVADILLNSIIRQHGVPSEVRTDAGSNLIAKGIRSLYDRMGIKMTIGTAYHHQLVALVERWHRTLGQLIRVHQAAVEQSRWTSAWYRCLPLMELAFNNTINPSTTYSPFFMDHLRHARLASDYLRTNPPELPKHLPEWVQSRLDDLNVVYDAAASSLRLRSLTAKQKYDLKHEVNLWYKPGDRVLLIKGSVTDSQAIRPKALTPVDGPFTISKVLTNDRYILSELKTRRIREVVHVSRLLPYFEQVLEDDDTWMLTAPPTNGRWPVLGLIGRRVHTLERADNNLGLTKGDQVLQYRVQWAGFDASQATWRALQSLGDIIELVKEYDGRHPPRPAEYQEHLELQARTPEEVPQPSEEAKKKRHMRVVPHHGEARPKTEQQDMPYIPPPSLEPPDDVASSPQPTNSDLREQRRLQRAQRREKERT